MSHRAPRYVAQFRCLAERCPDTCCAGQIVRLNASDVARLRGVTDADPDLSERFRLAVLAEPEGPTLRMGAGCAFLDADRLCSVVKRFGQRPLPDTCMLYPRSLTYLPDHVELRATAGCPEVARMLVEDPDALELGDAPEGIAEWLPAAGPRPEPTPYTARRDEVLGWMDALWKQPGPLEWKLAAAARCSGLLEPHYRADEVSADPETWALAEAQVADAGALQRARGWLSESDAADRELGAQLLFGTLMNLREGASPHYAQVGDAALGNYQRSLPPGAESRPFAALALVYAERAERFAALLAAADAPLTRHVRNEWSRVWFTHSRSVASHLFKLYLELAAVRILLVGSPALDAIATGAMPVSAFNAVVAEVLQVVARRLGSSQSVVAALEEQLSPEALGTDAAGRLRLLIGYC